MREELWEMRSGDGDWASRWVTKLKTNNYDLSCRQKAIVFSTTRKEWIAAKRAHNKWSQRQHNVIEIILKEFSLQSIVHGTQRTQLHGLKTKDVVVRRCYIHSQTLRFFFFCFHFSFHSHQNCQDLHDPCSAAKVQPRQTQYSQFPHGHNKVVLSIMNTLD